MLTWDREPEDEMLACIRETGQQTCLIQVLEVGLHVGGYLVVLVTERLSLVRDERVLLLAGGPLDLITEVSRPSGANFRIVNMLLFS